MKFSVLALLSALALTPSFARSAPRTLTCSLNGTMGHGQATVLSVTEDPKLVVIDLHLETKLLLRPGENPPPTDRTALISALLVGERANERIYASGLMMNDEDGKDHALINPANLSAQGELNADGTLDLMLIDSNRVLQRGFGAGLRCE